MEEAGKCCIRYHLVSPINCFKINRKGAYNKCCDSCLTKMREYQHENKEAIAMLQKKYYQNNKEAFRIYSKQWKIDNPEQFSNLHRI